MRREERPGEGADATAPSGPARPAPEAGAAAAQDRSRSVQNEGFDTKLSRRRLLVSGLAAAGGSAALAGQGQAQTVGGNRMSGAMITNGAVDHARNGFDPTALYPMHAAWTVERRVHERGFHSSEARLRSGGGLQPTAGEEAAQREVWGC